MKLPIPNPLKSVVLVNRHTFDSSVDSLGGRV